MNFIYKLVRLTAWLLVIVAIATLASGFLTTKYFLTPWLGYSLSYYIHTILVPLFFLPLFYLHSLAGIFILIARHPSWNKPIIKILAGLVWTGLLVLFVVFYLAGNPTPKLNVNQNQNTILNSNVATNQIALTVEEVKKHNSQNDCWMIISGKIYDLTSYLNIHPGGAYTILPYCGADGTEAFATKDRGQSHSSNAADLLNNFYIGNLGGQANLQTIQNTGNTNNVYNNPSFDREDD